MQCETHIMFIKTGCSHCNVMLNFAVLEPFSGHLTVVFLAFCSENRYETDGTKQLCQFAGQLIPVSAGFEKSKMHHLI